MKGPDELSRTYVVSVRVTASARIGFSGLAAENDYTFVNDAGVGETVAEFAAAIVGVDCSVSAEAGYRLACLGIERIEKTAGVAEQDPRAGLIAAPIRDAAARYGAFRCKSPGYELFLVDCGK